MLKMSDELLIRQGVHLTLGWIRGELYWIARTDTESIVVDPSIYDRYMSEHLARFGITRQTWTEYMQPAEEAWKRQCELENCLRANLDSWKQVPGVVVMPCNRHP